MATQGEINICIFKPLRSDASSSDEPNRLSAHLETAKFNGTGRRYFNRDAPTSSFVLTAWALLLKYYLATNLVSFASSGVGSAVGDDDKPRNAANGQGVPKCLIHSLEIGDHDTMADAVWRIQEPATQRCFDPALLPCFNTWLIYRPRAIRSKVIGKDEVITETAHQMDICLTVAISRNVLSLDMDLCATKFSPPLAHRLLDTYRHILVLISTGSPSQTVKSLYPLTAHDLRQIRQWNAKVPRRRNVCLHSVFENWARRRPRAPAVCSWDGDLTYAELNNLSTKLAHLLARLGVGTEIFVPYAFEKSVYAVVASLAVLKAGGAFVPVDFSHLQGRLKSIICRVGATLILASAKTAPTFEGLSSNVLIVDQLLLNGLREEEHNPINTVNPNNSAFVLFTSGSTGDPKGLVQEHASVCTVNDAYRESLYINDESRVLNFAAYTFDVSTVDVFTTLSQGGCICIPSEENRLNDIVRVINDLRVNWIDLTPSFAMASIPCPDEIPTLRTLVLAGEEVKREHVAHFTGRIDRVINCYGPAEAGGCLAHVYQRTASQPQTVGLALKSASCWIVDPKNPRRLAPIGATGELVVEGPTLAREYLKDPRKTDAAFFRHHGWRPGEGHRPRQRFYRTGDLVQYRPDGLINFIGRQDTQAKIRGQRIELTEIEQHLSGDKSIKRCLVEFPQSGVYANRLVGVIELHLGPDRQPLHAICNTTLNLLPADVWAESGFSAKNAAKVLAKRVPAYMMPATWLVVTSLPLTDSKKVDRRKVRNWLTDLRVSDNLFNSACVSTSSLIPKDNTLALGISRKVSMIIANENNEFSTVLDSRNFDLIAAGIDSIQIMTLSKWIHNTYGLKLSVKKLTQPGLTVNELARLVAAFQKGHEIDKEQSKGLDIQNEVHNLWDPFRRLNLDPQERLISIQPVFTVFLTGGTGFLGIEILRQLLCNHSIAKVIVHVRAATVQHGRERILAAARKSTWWSESFDNRLDIWLGDLGCAKLGLSGQQWDRLTGHALREIPIDAVIHNGAAVQWNMGYESLRASNTISTVQLLKAMAERRSYGRFVYVSGGQVLTEGVDDELLMATQGAHLTGYAQSKIVSELLVKRFAECEIGRSHDIRVVKPSYIIGDAQRGIANQGDYLWGLIKSVIELGTYGREGCNGWVFVSDVITVAKAVCEICNAATETSTVVKILDGVMMQDVWNLLTWDFGYELKAVNGDEWWRSLRSHVERAGSQHCLWALQDMLDAETGEIASTATNPSSAMVKQGPDVLSAIRSNIQYLRDDVGFLPLATPGFEKQGQGNSCQRRENDFFQARY